MPVLISRLSGQDYRHEGDLGIRGRRTWVAASVTDAVGDLRAPSGRSSSQVRRLVEP